WRRDSVLDALRELQDAQRSYARGERDPARFSRGALGYLQMGRGDQLALLGRLSTGQLDQLACGEEVCLPPLRETELEALLGGSAAMRFGDDESDEMVRGRGANDVRL